MVLLAVSFSLAEAPNQSPQPKSARVTVKSAKKHKRVARVRGQKSMDTARVLQIQEALVREHYLSSKPTGKWDAASQEAMRRYQADQGWQSKTVPDSRALIRLGLGPDQGRLLNPETAMRSEAGLPSMAQGSSIAATRTATSSSMPAASPVSSMPDLSPSR